MGVKYNPQIHHRRSIRLQGYDYGQAGLYFITICAWHRQQIFGAIEGGEMRLNGLGTIAWDEWFRTAEMRSNIELAEFVVMPNHIHGIIAIVSDSPDSRVTPPDSRVTPPDSRVTPPDSRVTPPDSKVTPPDSKVTPQRALTTDQGRDLDSPDSKGTPPDSRVTPQRAPTLRSPTSRSLEAFGKPTSNTIPTIVRGYKAAVTKQINILRDCPGCPVWQRNYYEHVIRSEADYLRIAAYILDNPRRWDEDSLKGEESDE